MIVETMQQQQQPTRNRANARRFVIVWHDDTLSTRAHGQAQLQAMVDAGVISYGIGGVETGSRGETPHLQMYVRTPRSVRLRAFIAEVHRYFPTAHVETAYADDARNIRYCQKEGDWFEVGESPIDTPINNHKAATQRAVDQYARAIELAKAGRWDEIDPQLRLRHGHSLNQVGYQVHTVNDPIDHQAGIWIAGPRGTRKTTAVEQALNKVRAIENQGVPRNEWSDIYYLKAQSKWWDGYNGEPIVFIDDLDPQKARDLGELLKHWGGHLPFPAEFKGGQIRIRPSVIIITANVTPEQVWAGRSADVYLDPILKRYEVIEVAEGEYITPNDVIYAINNLKTVEVNKDDDPIIDIDPSKIRRPKRTPPESPESPIDPIDFPPPPTDSDSGDAARSEGYDSQVTPSTTGTPSVHVYKRTTALPVIMGGSRRDRDGDDLGDGMKPIPRRVDEVAEAAEEARKKALQEAKEARARRQKEREERRRLQQFRESRGDARDAMTRAHRKEREAQERREKEAMDFVCRQQEQVMRDEAARRDQIDYDYEVYATDIMMRAYHDRNAAMARTKQREDMEVCSALLTAEQDLRGALYEEEREEYVRLGNNYYADHVKAQRREMTVAQRIKRWNELRQERANRQREQTEEEEKRAARTHGREIRPDRENVYADLRAAHEAVEAAHRKKLHEDAASAIFQLKEEELKHKDLAKKRAHLAKVLEKQKASLEKKGLDKEEIEKKLTATKKTYTKHAKAKKAPAAKKE